MPAYKSLLKSVEWVRAGKRRRCHHNCSRKHVPKGELCLVVREGMVSKGYCTQCAAKMIEKAREDLEQLAQTL